MRKHLLIISVLFASFFVSCKEDTNQLPLFDFGTESFEEPFMGLLSNRPDILVKSLEYPPFRWLMSDTVFFSKNLEIEFNDDCIRSKSVAYIQFTDTLYRPLNGIDIFVNGQNLKNDALIIKADSAIKHIQMKISVPPSMGDTAFIGYVLVKGIELDTSNNVDLQNSNTIIATWKCHHKIGWPIMLWIIWLILLIALILIILVFLWFCICATGAIMIKIGCYGEGVCKMSIREIAQIKFKTGWSNQAIKWIENMDIANVYMELPLKEAKVGNRRAFILKDLDGNMIDKGSIDRHTNKVTMSKGGQPLYMYKGELNSTELHHSGQHPNSLLVEMPYSQHKKYYKTLHTNLTCSKIDRQEFATIKKNYWKARSKMF